MKILTPLLKKFDTSIDNNTTNKAVKPKNNSAYLYLTKAGIISSTSKALLDIIKYNKGTLSGKPLKNIVHNKNIDTIYKVIESLTEENPFYKTKTKLIDINGTMLDVEMFLSITSLDKDASIFVIIRLSGTHIEMYNHIYEKKEKLRILSENTSHVEILFSPDLKCLYLSPSCEKLVGYHYSELVDKNMYHYVHPEDFELVWETFNVPIIANELTIHFRLKHKEGRFVIVEARIKKVYDDFGVISNFAVYLNDASKQKKYEKELIEAKIKATESNEIKTNFLASISHEFRTPLNAIIGYSNILSSTLCDNNHLEYLKTIESNGMQLLDMVNNILSYSQIEQNSISANIVDISLNTFTREIEDIIKEDAQYAKKENLKLISEWDYPEENPIIQTDIELLSRAMRNLLNNALKFTTDGYIKCGCKTLENNSILFYVEDSGIGIPKKFQEMIFKRFTQKDSSITKQFGGTGIGLAVTKRIVELLNGKIWVESKEGKGSTFYFKLPINIYS